MRQLAVFLATLPAVVVAHAEQEPGKPLWEAGVGVGALSMPDYLGSDQRHNYLLPLPFLVYRGDILRVSRDQVRGLLYQGPRSELDISLGASIPVRSDKNTARSGMADLDPTVEIGPQWSYRLRVDQIQATLRLPLRRAVAIDFPHGRGVGWVFTPSIALDRHDHPAPGWHSSMSTGPMFADRSYHAYYYTVAPADATADRPSYAAKGGYGGWNLTATLGKSDGRLWIGGFLRANHLGGAVFADSPLVRSKTAWLAGIGMAWTFATSEQLVDISPRP